MRLDDLPLVHRHYAMPRIGGADHDVAIVAVDDQEALLRQSQNRELLPFGLMMWESAVILARSIATRDLVGKRVLDLGCGAGLTAVVAAIGGAHVHAVDYDPLALELCRRNAATNKVTERIRLDEADWNTWSPEPAYDIVLGADIVYDRDHHDALLRVVTRAVVPGGRFLLADPRRTDTRLFVEKLETTFGHLTAATFEIDDVMTPGQTVTIELLEGTRPL